MGGPRSGATTTRALPAAAARPPDAPRTFGATSLTDAQQPAAASSDEEDDDLPELATLRHTSPSLGAAAPAPARASTTLNASGSSSSDDDDEEDDVVELSNLFDRLSAEDQAEYFRLQAAGVEVPHTWLLERVYTFNGAPVPDTLPWDASEALQQIETEVKRRAALKVARPMWSYETHRIDGVPRLCEACDFSLLLPAYAGDNAERASVYLATFLAFGDQNRWNPLDAYGRHVDLHSVTHRRMLKKWFDYWSSLGLRPFMRCMACSWDRFVYACRVCLPHKVDAEWLDRFDRECRELSRLERAAPPDGRCEFEAWLATATAAVRGQRARADLAAPAFAGPLVLLEGGPEPREIQLRVPLIDADKLVADHVKTLPKLRMYPSNANNARYTWVFDTAPNGDTLSRCADATHMSAQNTGVTRG